MTDLSTYRFRVIHLLSLIPIGIAIGFLLGIVDSPFPKVDDTVNLIASLGTAGLYSVAVYFAGSIYNSKWLGYVHMAGAIALLTTGLSNALYIVIAGSIIAIIIQNQLTKSDGHNTLDFEEILGWITISGTAILVQYLIYSIIFDKALPYTDPTVASLFLLVITFGIGKFVSVWIGTVFTQQALSTSIETIKKHHPPLLELLLIFVVGIMAVVIYRINELTFAIIIGFTTAQVVYEYRINHLRQSSTSQLHELSTLNRVAHAVSINLELTEVLDSIHSQVSQLVDASTIFVGLYDDANNRIEYPLVKTNGKTTEWQSRHLSNGMTDYVIRNKKPLTIQKSERHRLKSLGINQDDVNAAAYIGIPMMIGDKVIGVMGMLHEKHTEILGSTNLNVLQSIANQVSLSLRNATLYDRTTKLANNLSIINRSVQDVMFNLDQNEAMQAASRTAQKLTNAKQVAILLMKMQDTPTIELVQSIGLSNEFRAKLDEAQPDWFTSKIDEYRIVSNLKDSKDNILNDLADVGKFQAYAEIPLRSGNTIVGYMLIYHDKPHNYHTAEIDLLEMLTSQITVALDNADLLQALEVYASEQAELVHLSSISSSSLEIEKVIGDVSDLLRQMLHVDKIDIGLYVSGREQILIYVSQASGHLSTLDYRLPDFPEFQIDVKNMIQYPDILFLSDSKLSPAIKNYMSENNCQMLTVVPMVINNEVIGVILIGDKEERIFKDNERRLIEMATTQIAAQVHNAQIHTLTEEALVQRLEQLSLIEDIGQKISRSLDLDLIINNVLEAALRSTQADLASIALVKDASTLRIKLQYIQDGEIVYQNIERPEGTGVIGHIMETGIMRVIGDNHNIDEYVAPANGIDYRSSLAVPLSKGNQVIGVLNVESIYPNFFTDEHTGFIKSLVGHAIISIDNANLLEEHQSQIAVLSQLRELALSASTYTSANEVMQSVVYTAVDMLKGNGGLLTSYDHATRQIKSTMGWIRLGGNYVQDIIFIPESLLYQAAHAQETILVSNVNTNERYQKYEQLSQVNYASVIILPIKRRNQVTELLCITFKAPRHFSEQDHNTVQLLQVQIANQLENAILSEEIRTSNVRMRAILDSTRDGIILLDRDGNLQDANISAEDLLKIDLSNSLNQNFASVLMNHSFPSNDEESFAELIQTLRVLSTSPERNMIREYTLHPDGTLIYLREVSSPVWDTNNQIIGRLLSLRDVTEERALDDFRERLQSMIVHDLKAPLSAIISSMALGRDLLQDSDDEAIMETLNPIMDVAQESSTSLLQLVESMLDIGRMRRKQLNLKAVDISIQEIADTAYTTLMASFTQNEILFRCDIPKDLRHVYVDENLIGRVLVNLIQNAIKFTPTSGEIRVTAQMDESRDNFVRVMVSDDGPGIPDGFHEKIFGEFTTLDTKTHKQQRGSRGTGVGLTFCKLAIEEHGGQIWVSDEGPLSGATFAFTLPSVPPHTSA